MAVHSSSHPVRRSIAACYPDRDLDVTDVTGAEGHLRSQVLATMVGLLRRRPATMEAVNKDIIRDFRLWLSKAPPKIPITSHSLQLGEAASWRRGRGAVRVFSSFYFFLLLNCSRGAEGGEVS